MTPIERRPGVDRRIWFKREDLEPTGSHKDRAAAFQLAMAADAGVPGVVISSSGNAGIATSRYAELHDIPAFVFVHPLTDPDKLASIDGSTTTLVVTERAINGAKLVARELGMPNLRPSVSDDALTGYATLGDELAEQLDHAVDAVVLFATSGATAIAVARVLAQRRPGVSVHFVQGEGSAALADPASAVDDRSARSAAAGRLGVRRSRRARELQAAIVATGGTGHVARSNEVDAARSDLVGDGIDVSDESAANLVVARRLADAGHTVCCVISGAPPGSSGTVGRRIDVADEHEALAVISAGFTSADR